MRRALKRFRRCTRRLCNANNVMQPFCLIVWLSTVAASGCRPDAADIVVRTIDLAVARETRSIPVRLDALRSDLIAWRDRFLNANDSWMLGDFTQDEHSPIFYE